MVSLKPACCDVLQSKLRPHLLISHFLLRRTSSARQWSTSSVLNPGYERPVSESWAGRGAVPSSLTRSMFDTVIGPSQGTTTAAGSLFDSSASMSKLCSSLPPSSTTNSICFSPMSDQNSTTPQHYHKRADLPTNIIDSPFNFTEGSDPCGAYETHVRASPLLSFTDTTANLPDQDAEIMFTDKEPYHPSPTRLADSPYQDDPLFADNDSDALRFEFTIAELSQLVSLTRKDVHWRVLAEEIATHLSKAQSEQHPMKM